MCQGPVRALTLTTILCCRRLRSEMVTGGWIQRYHNYTTTCAWSIPLWIKNLKEKREEMIHKHNRSSFYIYYYIFKIVCGTRVQVPGCTRCTHMYTRYWWIQYCVYIHTVYTWQLNNELDALHRYCTVTEKEVHKKPKTFNTQHILLFFLINFYTVPKDCTCQSLLQQHTTLAFVLCI